MNEEVGAGPFLEPLAEALRHAIGARAAAADARTHRDAQRLAGDERLEQLPLLRLLVAAEYLVAAPEHDHVRRARLRQARLLAAPQRRHVRVRGIAELQEHE